jgi:hypothetical protein
LGRPARDVALSSHTSIAGSCEIWTTRSSNFPSAYWRCVLFWLSIRVTPWTFAIPEVKCPFQK